jgi:hypothetical protein
MCTQYRCHISGLLKKKTVQLNLLKNRFQLSFELSNEKLSHRGKCQPHLYFSPVELRFAKAPIKRSEENQHYFTFS